MKKMFLRVWASLLHLTTWFHMPKLKFWFLKSMTHPTVHPPIFQLPVNKVRMKNCLLLFFLLEVTFLVCIEGKGIIWSKLSSTPNQPKWLVKKRRWNLLFKVFIVTLKIKNSANMRLLVRNDIIVQLGWQPSSDFNRDLIQRWLPCNRS